MKLKAIIHKDDESGYWAEVPSLPGCVTQAETLEELQENLQEAIEAWFEAGEPSEDDLASGQVLELAV